MNQAKWMFGFAILVCTAGLARADKSPDGDRILMLGVLRKGHWDAPSAAAVALQLKQMGESAAQAPDLTDHERRCDGQECLSEIAHRRGIGVLLSCGLEELGGRAASVSCNAFDARTQQGFEKHDTCVDCSEEQIGEQVARTAGDLIDRVRHPAPASLPVRPARAPPVSPIVLPAPRRPALPAWRRRLAWILGGGAGGLLITAITLNALDGHELGHGCTAAPPGDLPLAPVSYDGCRYGPLVAAYGASYALSGVLIGGTILALTLPERRPIRPVHAVSLQEDGKEGGISTNPILSLEQGGWSHVHFY